MNNFTNHSGGAIGSDSYWDLIGREYGFNNHIHYWYLKPNPKSLPEHEITEEQYLEGVEMVHQANKTLKRQNIERFMNLLARNWMQVKNSENIYAIGYIKNNIVQGGTGWAIQMAIDNKKDVYVFNQDKDKWYYWNGKFEVCNTPVLSESYAGIGTRDIKKNGINAIYNVYKRTRLMLKKINLLF